MIHWKYHRSFTAGNGYTTAKTPYCWQTHSFFQLWKCLVPVRENRMSVYIYQCILLTVQQWETRRQTNVRSRPLARPGRCLLRRVPRVPTFQWPPSAWCRWRPRAWSHLLRWSRPWWICTPTTRGRRRTSSAKREKRKRSSVKRSVNIVIQLTWGDRVLASKQGVSSFLKYYSSRLY